MCAAKPFTNKGSAFYLLRRNSINSENQLRTAFFIHKASLQCYTDTIGPVPLSELTSKLPYALTQLPPLLWNSDKWLSRCEEKQPQLGDLIVCVERRNKISITGGFYTTREKMGEYSKSCDFVTWSSAAGNKYGFVYCSAYDMHPSIIKHISNLLNLK